MFTLKTQKKTQKVNREQSCNKRVIIGFDTNKKIIVGLVWFFFLIYLEFMVWQHKSTRKN
jgi:hypothetical protein